MDGARGRLAPGPGRPGSGPAPGNPAPRGAHRAWRDRAPGGGREAGGSWRAAGEGTRRGSRGAGCQQLQNEPASLPGILAATPRKVAPRQAGTRTGAATPCRGSRQPRRHLANNQVNGRVMAWASEQEEFEPSSIKYWLT